MLRYMWNWQRTRPTGTTKKLLMELLNNLWGKNSPSAQCAVCAASVPRNRRSWSEEYFKISVLACHLAYLSQLVRLREKRDVFLIRKVRLDWLYPNVGLPFTGERLCRSVQGKKEDRGPDLLLPSTASILLLFRHNCSFQRSFYSTLIDLQCTMLPLSTRMLR